jgi:adenosine deaminase
MAAEITPAQDYHHLPKVELHRHLEGSLRLSTMIEAARSGAVALPESARDHLAPLVQVQSDDPHTFRNFLSKFKTLRLFYYSPEMIRRVAREVVEDAARDHVHYMELSFTPVALGRREGFPLADVVEWVCESALDAAKTSNLILRFILNVNRHEPVSLAETVVQLALDYQKKGVVGLSLAGNEADFLGKEFVPLFAEARQSGLHLSIHSGEWAGPESIRFAIEDLQAERLAHGVRILEDDALVARARKTCIPLEVCITSNYQSGVVSALEAHPLMRMLEVGLNVTINTDDPGISGITLSDEYRQACEILGLSWMKLRERILAAARASFLAPVERAALIARLQEALERCCPLE